MNWRIEKRLSRAITRVTLALFLAASQHTQAQVQPATPELKSIAIRVLDEATGQPVTGAKISAPYLNFPNAIKSGLLEPSLTGPDGQTVFRYPVFEGQNFGFGIQHSNYASRYLTIMSGGGPTTDLLPAEYTFRLQRGMPVGGFVRDEAGQPVPGARVIPWGNDNRAFNSGPRKLIEYSSIARDETNAPVTDAKGFWQFNNCPPDLPSLRLEVVRPGGARGQFGTEPAEQLSFEGAKQVSLADLKKKEAVLTLKEGVTVRGIVVDSSGKPAGGVQLKERSGRNYYAAPYIFTNNQDGHFELLHRDATPFVLAAEAEGFATASTVVNPAPRMQEVRLGLARATPLRLRLLGEKDEPLMGAQMRPIEYRNPGLLLDWKGESDGAGRVVWAAAPNAEVIFSIAPTNYPTRSLRLRGDGAEHVIHFRKDSDKRITLKLKATDTNTSKPILKFEVWKTQQYEQFTTWGAAGQDGLFQKELLVSDLPRNMGNSFRLQVRADGYAPWTSEMLYFDEGDQEITAKPVKAQRPSGVVLQPDGTLAVNTKVFLNNGRGSLFSGRAGEFYTGQAIVSRNTGQDGKFEFDWAEGDNRMVFTHPAGFASMSVEELRHTPEVHLQPWARIEGVLRPGGVPKPNEQLSVKSPLSWNGLLSYNLVNSTTTDAQGHFVFTNLPPGTYVLYRQPFLIMGPTTESHRMAFALKAGETKNIDYNLGGRTVVGHVEAGTTANWKNDPQLLVLQMPEPPTAPAYYAFTDPKAYEKARQEYSDSPAVLEYEGKRQQAQLLFDNDGNFTADDVPPGKYDLKLRLTKQEEGRNARRFGGQGEVIGTLSKVVVIPPGKPGEEFDLGTFEMEISGPKIADSGPVTFQAPTLDGKPFDLASLRGKPVVLTFWANWAPKSKEQLDLVRAAQADIQGAAFVSVNLDEDPALAREMLREFGKDWIHLRLTGPSLVNVTEDLSINNLPVTFLIDDKGKTVARELEGKRLRSAAQRLAAKSARK